MIRGLESGAWLISQPFFQLISIYQQSPHSVSSCVGTPVLPFVPLKVVLPVAPCDKRNLTVKLLVFSFCVQRTRFVATVDCLLGSVFFSWIPLFVS